VGGSEQLFFIVARHYYLTGRPNRLFFRVRGEGSGGVPGGPPGGPGGPRGGPRGGPGGPKTKFIKIYEDPNRPHNSGVWIGMTPRDGREGRVGVAGGVPGGPGDPGGVPGGSPGGPGGVRKSKKDEIKKIDLTC
jgi:hypothetical protein